MIDHADHRFASDGSRTNVERIIDLAISGAQHDRDPEEAAQALVEAASANRALLSTARQAAAQIAARCEQATFDTTVELLERAYREAGFDAESGHDSDGQVLDLREPGSGTHLP